MDERTEKEIMPTLQDIKLNSLYCLFKGEWGTRKSSQALSFPSPQYWFSYDQKMESLLRPGKKFGIDFAKDVTYDDYNDWQGARKKLEQLQTNCPYRTVVIDSITSMGDAVNRQTLKLKGGTTTSTGSEAGKRIAGIPVNSIEDYNAEASVFQELIALTKDIQKAFKVNIILIGHVIRTDEKSLTGTTHVARTLVTGGKKAAAKIPGYCAEVYHFNIQTSLDANAGGKYGLITEHAGEDYARTSLPLPREILFGDKPLYDTWIKPAIETLMKETPISKF